jgi:hypothetical protein
MCRAERLQREVTVESPGRLAPGVARFPRGRHDPDAARLSPRASRRVRYCECGEVAHFGATTLPANMPPSMVNSPPVQ